ncbi:hypothetical protein ACLK1S_07840 [Escherichia coli]
MSTLLRATWRISCAAMGITWMMSRNHIPAQTLIKRLATMSDPVLMLSRPRCAERSRLYAGTPHPLAWQAAVIGICLGRGDAGEAYGGYVGQAARCTVKPPALNMTVRRCLPD